MGWGSDGPLLPRPTTATQQTPKPATPSVWGRSGPPTPTHTNKPTPKTTPNKPKTRLPNSMGLLMDCKSQIAPPKSSDRVRSKYPLPFHEAEKSEISPTAPGVFQKQNQQQTGKAFLCVVCFWFSAWIRGKKKSQTKKIAKTGSAKTVPGQKKTGPPPPPPWPCPATRVVFKKFFPQARSWLSLVRPSPAATTCF